MSLYGRVDSTANQTAVGLTRGNGSGSATETIVFCDETEAALNENKTRGITAPGWWAYRTYTDHNGNTRHKAEMLAFITNPEANDPDFGTVYSASASRRAYRAMDDFLIEVLS